MTAAGTPVEIDLEGPGDLPPEVQAQIRQHVREARRTRLQTILWARLTAGLFPVAMYPAYMYGCAR